MSYLSLASQYNCLNHVLAKLRFFISFYFTASWVIHPWPVRRLVTTKEIVVFFLFPVFLKTLKHDLGNCATMWTISYFVSAKTTHSLYTPTALFGVFFILSHKDCHFNFDILFLLCRTDNTPKLYNIWIIS